MGSQERRVRERADTRLRILDAARELFVRAGYAATTMRAIADRVEYTPTAIYHHFANKQALLMELCTNDFAALAAAFRKIEPTDDPRDSLGKIGAAYVQFGIEHPMQYQLLFMTRRPPAAAAELARREEPGESAYAILRASCAKAVTAGVFRARYDSPDEVAQMCWGSLHGLVALHIAMGEGSTIPWRDLRKTSARLSDALMRGLTRGSRK